MFIYFKTVPLQRTLTFAHYMEKEKKLIWHIFMRVLYHLVLAQRQQLLKLNKRAIKQKYMSTVFCGQQKLLSVSGNFYTF